ncbi:MAG: hypothetical protein OXC44_00115 [Proteobacteria bacterium]|nr:hypothetical protein [Pseudomonadota bacterium]
MTTPEQAEQEDSTNANTNTENNKEEMIKQLAKVVCICKGIPLSRFLPALKCNETVEGIHCHVGSGDGGCKGRRCSPRIETLLEKYSVLPSSSKSDVIKVIKKTPLPKKNSPHHTSP